MGSLNNTDPIVCAETVTTLFAQVSTSLVNVTTENLQNLMYFCAKGYELKQNEKFGKPLVAIGVYIAVASLFCIGCVLVDALRPRIDNAYRLTSKYFSLNVTSMTLIAIAMKLPVDLSGSMPDNLDQVAKIGSVAFMCTVLAIFNPSLASMDNKTLFENIIGLIIFVVTIAVDLLIQIGTGVIKDEGPIHVFEIEKKDDHTWEAEKIYYSFNFVGIISRYIGIMILLLLISISTAIISPSFKKTLEVKYQVRRKALNDEKQQRRTRIATVEELTLYVTRFWIMAKTGSPQFVMARNLLSYASLFLCIVGMMTTYMFVFPSLREHNAISGTYQSDYGWSIPVIVIVQFIGNLMGSALVFLRCIKSIQFKDDYKIYDDMFNLRKGKYWTEKLCEWKGSHIVFLSSYPTLRKLVLFMKNCVLSLCIGLQKAFVVLICQVLGRFGMWYLVLCMYIKDACLKRQAVISRNDDTMITDYVLRLDDEAQPSENAVQDISRSMNHFIKNAKKKQNNNLVAFLGKSNGFKNPIFCLGDVKSELINSWSVPVITLSSIAISVPGIIKPRVDSLIKSIDEALFYTHTVEERFDREREFEDIRRTAMTLWEEVRDKQSWFKNPIGEGACGQLPRDILTRFAAISRDNETRTGNEFMADWMHHISNAILSSDQDKIQTKQLFFEYLGSMIADILVACFTNLPQVIEMKCHANTIEKREESVEAAAKLLGESTEIIRKLQEYTLPNMDPEKRPYLHEWFHQELDKVI